MNDKIKQLLDRCTDNQLTKPWPLIDAEKFAKLIIEETMKQVDERCYDRGENQWYYEDDKRWIRLHFGYGQLNDLRNKQWIIEKT